MPRCVLQTAKAPARRYWQVFGLCFLCAAVLFLPHVIADAAAAGSFFRYAGDFNDQMVPFTAYANAFLKQGGTFSWATDLGSGFVNAYSYYCLGSPFFWLLLPLPARWVPWAIVPVLCLKFAVAGGGAYLWARRWLHSAQKGEGWAMLAGCLYAFCGANVYNIFFYFFLDAAALFPYLLKSLDDAVFDGRFGRLPLWVAVCMLTNYFFFAGQAVFLVLYFACLLAGRAFRLTPRLFGRLAWETLLGCLMGCLLLLPAGLSLLQNPRTVDPFNGYGYFFYNDPQQYGAILYSALLMPDTPYLADLFTGGVFKWTSLSAWLPVAGVAGGVAFCRAWRRHPFAKLLKVCVVCAFVPVLNSLFYALNSSYYARWYYMPVLVLCAATARALQSDAVCRGVLPGALGLVAAATAGAALFALVPNTGEEGTALGVVDYQPRFWALWGISLLGLGIFALLLRGRARLAGRFAAAATAAVLGFTLLWGTVHLSIGKYGQWGNDRALYRETYAAAEAVRAVLPAWEDAGFYRIDAYEAHNNLGIWFDESCLQHFNTTVAPHILEFYPSVGVPRDVNSKPDAALYALRGLLSVRYTLVPLDKEEDWQAQAVPGWTRWAEAGGYAVYENDNFLPMGFALDAALTPEELEAAPADHRAALLLRALVLPQADAAAQGLAPLEEERRSGFAYADYVRDIAACRANGVRAFTATRTGFTAETDYAAARWVLFTVPYDDGFTATVNGGAVPVHNADNGLMAVRVPAGHADIVFTYRTPGLRASAALTLGGLGAYLVYLVCLARRRHKKK